MSRRGEDNNVYFVSEIYPLLKPHGGRFFDGRNAFKSYCVTICFKSLSPAHKAHSRIQLEQGHSERLK